MSVWRALILAADGGVRWKSAGGYDFHVKEMQSDAGREWGAEQALCKAAACPSLQRAGCF